MARKESKSVTSITSFFTFTRHFLHYCHVLRALLGGQLIFVLLLGVVFAWCEGTTIGQGVYFSLITATTVGYGDIAPQTTAGQWIAVLLALMGTILFGLVVAVATQAFKHTIEEYLGHQGGVQSDSR